MSTPSGQRLDGAPTAPPAPSGDGLPTLPTGEPVLHRWFVLLMLLLVPIGVVVTIWAFLSIRGTDLPPAARRPPGTATVTHDRGDAQLNQAAATEPGPGCARGIEVFGDVGARAAGRRALAAVCQLLASGAFPDADAGLQAWTESDGRLRFAVFELTGVDSSARVEGDAVVVELNVRFQFAEATTAAPFVVHELVHLGRGRWPGEPVAAAGELAAMQAQRQACDRLAFRGPPHRGCRDAAQLLDGPDPMAQLRQAGYPTAEPT